MNYNIWLLYMSGSKLKKSNKITENQQFEKELEDCKNRVKELENQMAVLINGSDSDNNNNNNTVSTGYVYSSSGEDDDIPYNSFNRSMYGGRKKRKKSRRKKRRTKRKTKKRRKKRKTKKRKYKLK